MKRLMLSALVVLGLGAASPSFAQGEACEPGESSSECGWFWGYIERPSEEPEPELTPEPKPEDEREDPPEEMPEIVVPEPTEPAESEEAEQDCTDPEQWSVECGFVNPQGDFEFQRQQGDALLKNAAMNPNDPKAVEGLQYYVRWAVNQAITMSQMWQWNMIQTQELNPRAASPVSAFGIRAASRAQGEHRDSLIEEIKAQDGFLVWFTRDSCSYCHAMLPAMRSVKKRTELRIWNAPLDGECMEGFAEVCESGELTIEGARHLGIEAVPDLWLHLPKDDLWFRVSTGVESAEKIISRIELFFGGVQQAVAKGLSQQDPGDMPQVDFSARDMLERSRGGLGEGLPTPDDGASE